MTCHSPSMKLTLYFTKMTFQSTGSAVTSLAAHPDSQDVVKILCNGTDQPATTGDLLLKVLLNLLQEDKNLVGHQAIKNLTSAGKLERGPTVVGLKVTGNATLVGGVNGTGDAAGYKHGLIEIQVVQNVLGSELPVDIVRLDGATEENYLDVLGTGLPPNKTSSFRGRIRIPTDLTGVESVTVAWRAWLLGRAAGVIPPLKMTWRRIPRPVPEDTPTNLPGLGDESDLTLDTSELDEFAADQYAEVESQIMSGAPGDTLLFTVTREAAGGDGYNAELHLINQYGKITQTN